jgi:DNA-binding transcriptional LysR family regulator
VSPTEAGARLLPTVGPRLAEIEGEIDALSELREMPAGTIRITTEDTAVELILWPMLEKSLPRYPDIKLELSIDYGFPDITGQGFEAGVRFGESVDRDMIAVRIGPDIRFAAVASKSYFAKHSRPQMPQDLVSHTCINLRLPTSGGLYAWEFEKDGLELKVRVDGQLVFNNILLALNAAIAGFGIAYVPEVLARPISRGGDLSGFLKTGVHRGQDTTCLTRAAASPPRSLLCWSTDYAVAADGQAEHAIGEAETFSRLQLKNGSTCNFSLCGAANAAVKHS